MHDAACTGEARGECAIRGHEVVGECRERALPFRIPAARVANRLPCEGPVVDDARTGETRLAREGDRLGVRSEHEHAQSCGRGPEFRTQGADRPLEFAPSVGALSRWNVAGRMRGDERDAGATGRECTRDRAAASGPPGWDYGGRIEDEPGRARNGSGGNLGVAVSGRCRRPPGLAGRPGTRCRDGDRCGAGERRGALIGKGQPMTAHWGVADPAAFQGTDEQKTKVFWDTASIIKRRIELMLSLPLATLDKVSIQREIKDIGTR